MSAAPAMSISAIRIGARHRAEMGDLRSLAKSIEEVGLLHPIVVDTTGALVGMRRLQACTALGWEQVPVTIIEVPNGS